MLTLLEILVYGAVQSSVYALLAIGFSLIFGVAGVVNLAHTGFFMVGAYLIYTFVSLLGLNLYVALVLAVILTGFLGILVQHYAIRPLIKSEYSVMIITVALAMFFQEVILSTFGPVDRNLPNFYDATYKLFGLVPIDFQRLLTLIVAIVLIVCLWFFIKRTKFGRAMQAVAQDRQGAIFMGISPNRVYLQVMFISACLAAVAGALIVPLLGARAHMWEHPLVRVFICVVLGGLGSFEGTILAALIIGFTEVIVAFSLSSYLGELVAVAIILLVLCVRPTGLMGKRIA
ncbi:MAG: branched-chain amino acid ABC transporter permease [Deltaproteobacteria bacterium]|nr:branched-chain amino acid ABC transporter permease [Deltaproteobacteria bacterium]